MKALKFKVVSEEHSIAIQRHLFSLGYTWSLDEPGKVLKGIDMEYLRTDTTGRITYGTVKSLAYRYAGEWTTLANWPVTGLADLSKYTVREIDVDKELPMHIGGGRWLHVNEEGKVYIFESKRQAE